MRNAQPGVEADRGVTLVDELKGESACISRLNHDCCGYDQTDSAPGGTTDHVGAEIIRHPQELKCCAEHELLRMEPQGVAEGDTYVFVRLLSTVRRVAGIQPCSATAT